MQSARPIVKAAAFSALEAALSILVTSTPPKNPEVDYCQVGTVYELDDSDKTNDQSIVAYFFTIWSSSLTLAETIASTAQHALTDRTNPLALSGGYKLVEAIIGDGIPTRYDQDQAGIFYGVPLEVRFRVQHP